MRSTCSIAKKGLTAAALLSLVAAGAAAGRVHRVREGETLEAVARRYRVPVSSLAQANGLGDPNRIVAGKQLVVPAAGAAMRQVVAQPVPAAPATKRRVQVPADRARLRPLFSQFAKAAGVPPELAMALAWQESGWQTKRVSSTRAVGVMQLMPDTVEFVSKVLLKQKANLDPRDPAANIRMGTRFLRYLLDASGGNIDMALASYYQGLRSVREVGPFEDTKRFVANVKALRARF